MLEDLWNGLIQFSAVFITPDWGSLVVLLPLILAVVVVLYLAWTVFRFATAGPTSRGIRGLSPVAPARIHAPAPALSTADSTPSAELEAVADSSNR
jgi:hypothetical protein